MPAYTKRRWAAPTLAWVALGVAGCPEPDVDPPGAGSTSDPGRDPTGSADETGSPGLPPPVPQLLVPLNGAMEVPIETELCWGPVIDPDGDSVRYRVFVDGNELTEGKLDQEGHEGPCIGPLNFNHDQLYQWQVQAFDPLDPLRASALSSAFAFRTVPDGLTVTVFEDPFDDDLGWEEGGDALDGAWVRGNPFEARWQGALSQPGECAGGQSCVFTGQNPGGVAMEADVQEGSTTLTSPAFDLSGYEAATVTLSRFVFKSQALETGTLFRVELLVPQPDAPGEDQVFVLDQVEQPGDTAGPSNAWMPVEYAVCNVPMAAGSRLRLVATDLGEGVLEAAVDSVVVAGHLDGRVCSGGEGSVCDPTADDPCGGGLLCCARGVVNKGVYRCSTPVPSITYPDPGGPVGTMNGPLGCDAPDLFVEPEGTDPYEEERYFGETDCEIFEGCVAAPGFRRLLRFDTRTPNAGSMDLVMGVPSNHPDLFHYSECHEHYHFDGYAFYDLIDGTGAVVATGHKQAFCLLDWTPWAWPDFGGGYTCGNQGISVGWEDVYGSYLDCQYVDVTDVPPGDYTLRISVNLPLPDTVVAPLVERDYGNNTLELPVTLTGE